MILHQFPITRNCPFIFNPSLHSLQYRIPLQIKVRFDNFSKKRRRILQHIIHCIRNISKSHNVLIRDIIRLTLFLIAIFVTRFIVIDIVVHDNCLNGEENLADIRLTGLPVLFGFAGPGPQQGQTYVAGFVQVGVESDLLVARCL